MESLSKEKGAMLCINMMYHYHVLLDEVLKKAKKELEEIRQEVTAWQAQCDGAQFKIEKEKAISESLKVRKPTHLKPYIFHPHPPLSLSLSLFLLA